MRSLIGYIRSLVSGLRFRLLLLLLLACAPLIALTLDSVLKDRRQAKADLRDNAGGLLTAFSVQEESVFRSTRQALMDASKDSGIHSMKPTMAKRSLVELARRNPRYVNLGLATTNGEVVTSVNPVPVSNIGTGMVRRAIERRNLFWTKVDPARTNTARHVRFFYPVERGEDLPDSVVFAEIDMTKFDSLRPGNLPAGSTWMVIDDLGNIIFRFPQSTPWIGQNVRDPWLVTNIFAQTAGLLEGSGPFRTPTFYAFNTVQSRFMPREVAFVLATPRQILFAKADAAMWQKLFGLGVAVGFAMMLGWVGSKLLILQPVEALARSSARLAAGDLSVRTGLQPSRDELGQLTLAFDQMAHALQQRELDRQRATHKLQLLSHNLVEVQESERRHIARELHDEIGQSLTAAGLNLQAALQMSGSVALERRLKDSIQAVEKVLEQVHDLSLNLRPSMLDDLGLEPALRWYTHRQAALTGLRAEFRGEALEERLDPVVETECFRVAQEALTNVVRHARAHGVTVELSKRNGHLHLCVRDDGVGFDVASLRDKAVRGASLGLLSMEERASLAGGGVELHSTQGMGTEVHAWFPLKGVSTTNNVLSQFNE